MNIFLWVLQVLLALHTVMGAVWKFSNPPGVVPSLSAIPNGAWLAMSVVELLCAVALVLPALTRRVAILAPVAAACIAAEMMLLCGVHIASGTAFSGQVIYRAVVAAICAFLAYGRLVLMRLRTEVPRRDPDSQPGSRVKA